MAITTITNSMVSVNAIQGTLIADNAITAVHIASNAVASIQIAENNITAREIAANTITVAQLADDCVESDKIADGVITTNHLNKAMISSQTEVAVATGDFILLGDTSDSNNLKKAPISSILAGTLTTAAQTNITSVGTLTGFTSTGIDDNADATAITIDSSENVGIGETSPLGKLHVKTADSGVSSANANADDLIVENSDYTGISILGENESNIHFGDNEDPDVGRIEYSHSSNHMVFRTNASDRMLINSSGNVGIGTDIPSGKLDVHLGATGIIAEFRGADSDLLQINSESDLIALDIRNTTNGLDFQFQGTSKMRINSSGNVGIGTTSPSQKLHVVGKMKLTDDLIIGGASPRIDYDGGSTGALRFFSTSANTERMRIESGGNVGIGTTSPSSLLHMESGNAHNKLSITSTASGGTGYDAVIDLLGSASNSEVAINMGINGDADREQIKTYQSAMTFRTNNADRWVIESGGKFYGTGQIQAGTVIMGGTNITYDSVAYSPIGTNSTGASIGVFRDFSSSYPTLLFNTSDDAHFAPHDADMRVYLGSQGGDFGGNSSNNLRPVGTSFFLNSGGANFVFERAGTGVGYVDAGGFNDGSDEALKKDIADLTYGLDTVKSLKPRKFKWKSNSENSIGFIAQEVESIIPEVVGESNASGTPTSFKGLSYGHLTAVLTKAIQEQQTIIEDLEARVKELEG